MFGTVVAELNSELTPGQRQLKPAIDKELPRAVQGAEDDMQNLLALSEIREATWRYYDWHVRTWAVLLWGRYPESIKSTGEERALVVDEAVSMLLRTLRTENSAFNFLDLSVAQALGEIGPEAKAAVPPLIERLREDQGKALVIFGDALHRIDPSVDLKKAMTKK